MTKQELVAELENLAVEEKLELIELLSKSVRSQLELAPTGKLRFSQLRGIARTEGHTPSDEELRDAYVDYLIEKYS